MSMQILDTLGQKGYKSVTRIAMTVPDMRRGDILEVWGDAPTFERDVRTWCDHVRKPLLSVAQNGPNVTKIRIQF